MTQLVLDGFCSINSMLVLGWVQRGGLGGYHSKVGWSFPVQKGLHLLPMHLRCYVSGTQGKGFRLLEALLG